MYFIEGSDQVEMVDTDNEDGPTAISSTSSGSQGSEVYLNINTGIYWLRHPVGPYVDYHLSKQRRGLRNVLRSTIILRTVPIHDLSI